MSRVVVMNNRLYTDEFSNRVTHGSNGFTIDTNEGDKCTPIGDFKFLRMYYRPDRIPHPLTNLPAAEIRPDMGWCDDSLSSQYNQEIRLPFNYGFEPLWREDHVYDMIVVISQNTNPIIPGKGSAIFFHIWRGPTTSTEGCVAMEQEHLLRLVRYIEPGDVVSIRQFA